MAAQVISEAHVKEALPKVDSYRWKLTFCMTGASPLGAVGALLVAGASDRAVLQVRLLLQTRPATHYTLHTSHCTLHTTHYTLHTTHYTLHTSHYTLHTTHFTLHTTHFATAR